ncbi:MAG: response regulator transcription factor [Solirubrobacteraceae bacterium]
MSTERYPKPAGGWLPPAHARYRSQIADCPLSQAELDVLKGVAEGLTRSQIAQRRHCTVATVAQLASRARRRLHVSSLPAAVVAAMNAGWIDRELGCEVRDPPLGEAQRNYAEAFGALIRTSPTARARLVGALADRRDT